MEIKRIFVDMDEVFSDFTGGALKMHGLTREELESRRPPGIWNITGPLGVSEEEFWKPIHDYEPEFWLRLRALPWALEMNNLLNKTGLPWLVATSPNQSPHCYTAKVQWCRRFFGSHRPDPIILRDKTLLASTGSLLIDDSQQTCSKFILAGGLSIVFPTRGNSFHALSDDPVSYVKEKLDVLLLLRS